MRHYFHLFIFVLLGTVPVAAQPAWKRGDEVRGQTIELTGKQAENISRIVSNMPWLQEDEIYGKGKYLYVIYTPSCSISQDFYDKTRKISDKVKIRWIPVDPEGSLNSMYEQRNGKTVRAAFKTSRIPPDQDAARTKRINTYSMGALSFLLIGQMLSPDGNIYYPTLVYGTPEKLHISVGPVDDINKLLASIPDTEQPQEPEAVVLGANKIDIIPVSSASTYTNNGKEKVTLHLAADKDAVVIGGLPSGEEWPLPITGATQNGFIVSEIAHGGAIFIHDPDFTEQLLKK